MKKVILFCLLVAVLLSACGIKDSQNEITPSTTELTMILKTELNQENKTQNIQELTENKRQTDISIANFETEVNSLSSSVNKETDFHPEPPYMISFTLESFKRFKRAYQSMSDADFVEFLMTSDDDNYYDNCIRSREDAKKVIDTVENNTVVLLDGQKENFYEITFYIESNYIVQPVIVTDNRNLVCRYYPKQNEKGFSSSFAHTEKAVFIKEVSSNGVTAKVYDYDGELNAEMIVNETRIAYRVTEPQTIEEFEADFARLEFVKIGDLLNE